MKLNKGNVGALFDQKERFGGTKTRNNASSFLFLMISAVFRLSNASTFPLQVGLPLQAMG